MNEEKAYFCTVPQCRRQRTLPWHNFCWKHDDENYDQCSYIGCTYTSLQYYAICSRCIEQETSFNNSEDYQRTRLQVIENIELVLKK